MRDYHKLDAWKVSHDYATDVVRSIEDWSTRRQMVLGTQLARAAISVPTNVAEGSGRSGAADFARFLTIALGSLNESQYQLELAAELGWLHPVTKERLVAAAVRARAVVIGLRASVRRFDN